MLLLETPKISINELQETPKKKNALNDVGTPLTPTPTKLFEKLNVRTPETEIKKKLFPSHRIQEQDQHRNQRGEQKEDENPPNETNKEIRGELDFPKKRSKPRSTLSIIYDRRKEVRSKRAEHLRSWQDIEVTPQKNRETANHQNQRQKGKESKESGSAFESLLKSTQSLSLPLKWTILIEKFNALESTMALYQRKSMFYVHYQNVSNSVRQICKKKFMQRDLQEIVSIIPDFYHLQWTPYIDKVTHKKDMRLTLTAMDYDPYSDQQIEDPFSSHNQHSDHNENDDENITEKKKGTKDRMNEIGIRFLKVSKLKEREKVFRVRLVQYLVFHHRQFLIDNDLVEFNPLDTGKWHRKFDLENVNEIEISPLPQREKKGADEIEKMINEQKKRLEDIVQKEMERAKEEEKMKKELANDPMMGKAMVIPKHLSHLSPTMVARIRAKEKGKTMVTTKSLHSAKEKAVDDEHYRLQQLPYLVTLVRGIYVSSRKSSMACNDLIALVKKRHRNKHILGKEIWAQLQLLGDLKSRLFIIKQGAMVKVARLNKKVSTKEVLDEIQKKIKKC